MRWEFWTRRQDKLYRPYSRPCFDYYVLVSSLKNFYSSSPRTKESSPKRKKKIEHPITCRPCIGSFGQASAETEATTKAWAATLAINGKKVSWGRELQFTGLLKWATSHAAYQKRQDSSSNLPGRRITSETLPRFPDKEKRHNPLRWNKRSNNPIIRKYNQPFGPTRQQCLLSITKDPKAPPQKNTPHNRNNSASKWRSTSKTKCISLTDWAVWRRRQVAWNKEWEARPSSHWAGFRKCTNAIVSLSTSLLKQNSREATLSRRWWTGTAKTAKDLRKGARKFPMRTTTGSNDSAGKNPQGKGLTAHTSKNEHTMIELIYWVIIVPSLKQKLELAGLQRYLHRLVRFWLGQWVLLGVDEPRKILLKELFGPAASCKEKGVFHSERLHLGFGEGVPLDV
jgi:hypothetical protein